MEFNEILLDIAFPFLGGLGLFLFGMKLMSDNLERTAGSKLRKMLEVLTSNRIFGMIFGALFTMVIQSSSATTVMVVGFVNAGLMNLLQATSVIMGANIGTTITAQLVAFNLTEIAPAFLFVGVFMYFFLKNKQLKNVGAAIAGFGILFVGMSTMSTAMKPLREMESVINIIGHFDNPVYGVLAGAALTVLIQSSSASMGILLAMAGQGLINLQGAMFIILGFNIGTCITAVLAVIGANKTAKRAAAIHLMFNIFGSLIFIFLVQVLPIDEWIIAMSDSTMRQLANFHMVFNIAMTLLLLPFAGVMVNLSKKIIPGEDTQKEPRKLQYIEEHMFSTPTIVVTQIGKEVERMAMLARVNIEESIKAFVNKDAKLIETVLDREQVIDFLNHEITGYLVKANTLDLSETDSAYISHLFHVVTDLERIGDHAENIVEFAESSIDRKLPYTDSAYKELEKFSKKVFKLMDVSLEALNKQDPYLALEKVGPMEDEIDEMEAALRKRHIKRLKNQKCNARSGTIFIDLLSNLERVADHSTNIAQSVLYD